MLRLENHFHLRILIIFFADKLVSPDKRLEVNLIFQPCPVNPTPSGRPTNTQQNIIAVAYRIKLVRQSIQIGVVSKGGLRARAVYVSYQQPRPPTSVPLLWHRGRGIIALKGPAEAAAGDVKSESV